jgi:hypothetical protein
MRRTRSSSQSETEWRIRQMKSGVRDWGRKPPIPDEQLTLPGSWCVADHAAAWATASL